NATEVMLDDAEFGMIAALVVDGWHFDLFTYHVPRVAAAEARIRETVAAFWQNVNEGKPPRADYTRDGRLLALMYPKETPGKEIDLRGDNWVSELLAERGNTMAQLKLLDGRKDAIEAELRDRIGDAEIALVDGWKVKLKEVVTKEHVRKESRSR